jgi:aminocarboxymuconate-semialdehyde decarboxylase
MARKAQSRKSTRKPARAKAPVRRARKPFVIDMHTHIRVPALLDYVKRYPVKGAIGGEDWFAAGSLANVSGQDSNRWTFLTEPQARLAEMDKQGVDIQIISTNFPVTCYYLDPEIGAAAARATNDAIAEFCAADEDRFVGIASVPLQDANIAAGELERAVKSLGLRGAWIASNVRARDLGEAEFRPFWAKAEKLGVPVFVHPLGTTDLSRLTKNFLFNTIGQPLEEAMAMSSLIYGGIMDDYPKLEICICHGGGYLPYYIGRSDHAYRSHPENQDAAKKRPSAYLTRFWYDTVIFDPDMLPYLVKKAGANKVMMGSDWPLVRTDAVGYVARSRAITEDARARILYRNCAGLLGLSV